MTEIIERLASIETTQGAMKSTLDEVSGYLQRSVQEIAGHHTETVRQLSVIENNQKTVKEDLKEYERLCTDDRINIVKKMGDMEIKQAHQTGKNAGIAVAISTLIAGGAIVIEWLKK